MSVNKFSGSVPEIYHRYLVPLIFEAYADDLSERLNVSSGGAVLETAMGTGVLTERLIAKLSSQVMLIATDFSPAMLEVAQSNLPSAENVSYKEANGVDLPFNDSSFDSLVCQFGVMFFPDIEQGYREAYRVLKSGGEFIFNVWDKMDYNEIPRIVHDVALTLDNHNPPDFLKTPWSYNDVDAIVNQLKSAGFSDIKVTVLKRESASPSARDVALALGAGSPLAMQLEERGLSEVAIDRFTEALKERFGDGPVSAPMQAIVFQAR